MLLPQLFAKILTNISAIFGPLLATKYHNTVSKSDGLYKNPKVSNGNGLLIQLCISWAKNYES
jgi:hypothetical protein